MMNAVSPIDGYVYIGTGFDPTHAVTDIDPATCLINGVIAPTGYVVGTFPGFSGDVLRLTFDLAAFAGYYDEGGLVWDCVTEDFTVTGDYFGGGSFSVGDDFQFCGHISGDLNVDGSVDITDLVMMVNFMFTGGQPPVYLELADVNGSGGNPDISDLVHWVTWAFQGGPALQHP
jgi:hypothetical protein